MVRIGRRQQRPPLLPVVDIQRRLYQVPDRVLMRHDQLYRPQAPLDRHIEQQLRQPGGGTADGRSRIKPSRDGGETSWPSNDAGVSVRG